MIAHAGRRTELPRTTADFAGMNVTVMGLGLFGGGLGATRFLAEHGATVTVTDLRPAKTLAPSLEKLAGLEVRYVLGEHQREDFRSADLIVVNPAVNRASPFLKVARACHVLIETEISLFFRYFRGRVVGVTGSNGKTTTTTLLARMLSLARPRVLLGGNCGRSLLAEVDHSAPEDLAVLELSSFQLEYLGERALGPAGAVITNLTPNHLDRHRSFRAYREAKKQILRHVEYAVVDGASRVLMKWGKELPRFFAFGIGSGSEPGVWVDGDALVIRDAAGAVRPLLPASEIPIPGVMNRLNVAAAAAAALAEGAPADRIVEAVRAFEGVPHRLELVHQRGGVKYINDSVSTTPESTLAGLGALDGELVLLLGGYDKGLDIEPLLKTAAARARVVIAMGSSADRILQCLDRIAPGESPARVKATSFEQAVREASSMARPGESVLLSPAFASYDWFTHFEQRGDTFRRLVREIA